LPRNALSSVRLGPVPAWRLSRREARSWSPLARSGSLSRTIARLAPVHADRCHRFRASLSFGDSRRLLQPFTTRGHTRRAFDPRTRVGLLTPLLAGTNRCRLRRLDDALPRRQPASHDRRATARRTSRSTRVEMTNRGSECSSEGQRASMTIRACRLVALRAPGSPSKQPAVYGLLCRPSRWPRPRF
jgi:hypothetical protein